MNVRFVLTLTGSLLLWISCPLACAQGKKDRAQRDKSASLPEVAQGNRRLHHRTGGKGVFEKLTTPRNKTHSLSSSGIAAIPIRRPRSMNSKRNTTVALRMPTRISRVESSGWKTDRGRIYIIHGPPDQREAYPTGGNYERREYEGGGFTSVYPFERWWYRNLPGVGSDVELEFIDPKMSNEYYLAWPPKRRTPF